MPSEAELRRLWNELQRRYRVGENQYPGIDLMDLPRGPLTEVALNLDSLGALGLDPNPDSLHFLMDVKRSLAADLARRPALRREVEALAFGKVGLGHPATYDFLRAAAEVLIAAVLAGFGQRVGEELAGGLSGFVRKWLARRKLARRGDAEVADLVTRTTELRLSVTVKRVKRLKEGESAKAGVRTRGHRRPRGGGPKNPEPTAHRRRKP